MNLLELAQKAFGSAVRNTAQAATQTTAPMAMPAVSWLMPPSQDEAEGYKTINRAVGAPQQALFKFSENPEEGLKPAIDYAFNYVDGKEPRISGRDLLKTRGMDLDANPSLPGEFVAAGLDVLADPILLAGEAVSGAKKLAGIKETDTLLRKYFVKQAMKRPGAVETLTEFYKPNQLVKAGEDVRITLEPAYQEFKNTLKKSGILDALEKKVGGNVIKETLIPQLDPNSYHVFGGIPMPEIPKNLIAKLKISAADLTNLKAGSLDKVNPALIVELTKVGIIKSPAAAPNTAQPPTAIPPQAAIPTTPQPPVIPPQVPAAPATPVVIPPKINIAPAGPAAAPIVPQASVPAGVVPPAPAPIIKPPIIAQPNTPETGQIPAQVTTVNPVAQPEIPPSILKSKDVKHIVRETTGQVKIKDLVDEMDALNSVLKVKDVAGKDMRYAVDYFVDREMKNEVKLNNRQERVLKDILSKRKIAVKDSYKMGKKEGVEFTKIHYDALNEAAHERKQASDTINGMLSDINKLPTESLPLDYKDKIEDIKSNFDLKKRSSGTMQKRDSMRQFVERMKAEGKELSIPQEKLDILEKVSLNNMTLDDLREVHEVITRLYHQGRIKNKLLTSSIGREFGDVVKDGVNAITKGEGLNEESSIIRALRNNSPSWQDKSLEAAKWYVAIHLRAERICNMLDGWKEGINTKTMFVPLLDAENLKLESQAVSLKRLVDIHKNVKIPDLLTKQYDIGRFTGMTKDTAMFVYANSFNDANRAHLYGSGIMDEDIDVISKFLAPEERQAVEDLIRYYDTEQWPALDKVYSELEGSHVGKEDSYFPIMNLEEVTSTQEIAMEILARAHVRRAGVSQGFTKERVTSKKGFEKFSYFETIYRNWTQVEHYKAFAKPMRDVTHYLYNPDIKGAIKQKYGDPVFKQLDNWVKDVSYGMNRQSKDVLDKVALFVRTNYATAVLGFNLLSMIKQPVSFIQGVAYIGERAAISGTLEYLSNPIRATKIAYEKSPMMRNRAFTQERELREILQGRGVSQKFGQVKWTNPKELYQMIKEGSMWPMMKADQIACVSLWMGAYRDVIRTGRIADEAIPIQDIEKRARAFADEVVRKTQSMGGVLHLPGVFRGGNFQQLFTLFKNSLNQNFNMIYESTGKWRSGGTNKKFSKDMFYVVLLTSYIMGMIARRKLPADAKQFFKDLAFDTFDQTTGGLIILGQLASAYTQQFAGMNPIDSAVQDITNLAKSKKPITLAKNAARIAGKATGLPYVAAERAISGRWFGGKAEKPKNELDKMAEEYGLARTKKSDELKKVREEYGLAYAGEERELASIKKEYGL